MKQTVEEAAKENILFNHRTVDRTLFGKDFYGLAISQLHLNRFPYRCPVGIRF